jgi:hypothetical protein
MLGAVMGNVVQPLHAGAVVRQALQLLRHHEQQPGTAQTSVKTKSSCDAVFMAHLLASLWLS